MQFARNRRTGAARHRVAFATLAAGLAGTLALSAPALASTAHVTHHPAISSKKESSKTSSNSYASVESELTSLENAAPSGVSLLETGSTLLYPVISEWASQYTTSKVTTAGTGSGTGIADATNGTVQIGASDAYLPSTHAAGLLNIPVDVSAQEIAYNLPGLSKKTHLRLNATVINAMYDGSITHWNASAIQKLNPKVTLPDTAVIPIHRSDGSGDTFLFTSYVSAQDPNSWVPSHGGPNTSVTWPSTANELAAVGNGGMVQACESNPGCIAYIGVSYLRTSVAHGLGDAALQNGSHNFVLPNSVNISDEVASYHFVPASGAISLIDGRNSRYGYPIVNFEYAIVNENQPSASTAKAIQAFLAWGMDPRHGSSVADLADFYFHPLAPGAMKVAINLLKKIQ